MDGGTAVIGMITAIFMGLYFFMFTKEQYSGINYSSIVAILYFLLFMKIWCYISVYRTDNGISKPVIYQFYL